jgi:hypothetical protein
VFSRGARLFAEAIRKMKLMALSGSNDRFAPDGGNAVFPSAAGPRKAAEHRRLAEALRANLGRRKEQKRDRMKQARDGAESKTAQSEGAQTRASTKQD